MGTGPTGVRDLHQPWQARSFGYYDLIGECWNPAQFYARGLAKIRYFPATQMPDGELVEIKDGPAVEALANISHVASEYGRLIFLVGEGRLCQSREPDSAPDSDIIWEFLSPTEVALSNEGRTIVRNVSGSTQDQVEYDNISEDEEGQEPSPGEMRMWRFWRKHPKNSHLADSPIRPVLDLYEQLWWLTMRERADLQSRIADSGLLLIPEEIDFGPEESAEQAVDGDDPMADPFQEYVGNMMMTAIGDPGSASASVPGVIRGPAEFLHPDSFRMVHTHEPGGSLFTSQREEAIIRRIAIGLDLPVEEVLGMSKANHWTAWKVEDQKWQHLEPIATMFAKDVGDGYLRPVLIASGDVSPEEAKNIMVGYDNSAFARDPDKGKTAITLHGEGLLSGIKTLEANGWSDQDVMDPDEHEEWLAIQLRNSALIPGAEPAPPTQGPPTEPTDTTPPPEPDAAARGRAVAFAVTRARTAAGALVRSARRSCPDCLEGAEGVAAADLMSFLGPEKVGRLIRSDEKLVEVMAASFVGTLTDLGWDAPLGDTAGFFARTLYGTDGWPPEALEEITASGDPR